ncbi:MAG TPA: MBL fold metallo-hydrolase [Planctomycetota bacterium]|nr:MBL fold metallo-hydrolase [Planctomycetota bacterium]
MRVHHLNCVSTCPLGGALMDGRSKSIRGRLACHCLLLEHPSGLVLVDTGFGTRDVLDPRSRLAAFFRFLVAPELRQEMTAIRQIEKLGFDPRDVRHIVLTHLDFDHAGGLDDFPWARVHLLGSEKESATARRTWLDKQRYRPQQWSTQASWKTHPASGGTRWQGFDAAQEVVEGVLLVPLIGHTLGHAGVAIAGSPNWLLLAGDAYFCHAEMDIHHPSCTPGLRFYQWMMEKDRKQRLANQVRLRELVRDAGATVRVFSSHDPVEFEELAGRPLALPAATRQDRGATGLGVPGIA